MSALMVALMVLAILGLGLAAVLVASKLLRREADKVRATRPPAPVKAD